ncbi:MAG TPA: PEP/pyruvate-binding domain-containing protein [Acidimicrobiales bacterium]|nr:PEP/pyruvate-binding domain-containing protein [Acidimicrobiales bacterium]
MAATGHPDQQFGGADALKILAPKASARLERPLPADVVVALHDRRALDAALVGAKAASLARAALHGLPVLPGFVLTTRATAEPGTVNGAEGQLVPAVVDQELEVAWRRLSAGGRRLVVRSSSTVEDGHSSSMAGLFTSVLDVEDWPRFLLAVERVLSSRKAIPGLESAPMAVLVQPQLDPRSGGVLFGADPVTGRTDRLLVAAVEGGPDQLVSGVIDGAQYLLSPRGRCLKAEHPIKVIGSADLRSLSRLADRVAGVFGGPQDVEWAFGEDGTLHLLQSRPITAVGGEARAEGPVLGPGPVAETFPDPLTPLEEDLWVAPLRVGLTEALDLVGVASRRQLAVSPVVVTVGGRVAVDLAVMGLAPVRRKFLATIDPRPPARRLRASWKVGRLRAAVPALARDLIDEVDSQLLGVDAVEEQSDGQLIELLGRSHQALVALHGHEILVGLLVSPGAPGTTGAAMALRALAQARFAGVADDEIAHLHPVVLALAPPAIREFTPLPATPTIVWSAPAADSSPDPATVLREALRLRVRWVQELTARAAWELGLRLGSRGTLPDVELVRYLTLDELRAALSGAVPDRLVERKSAATAAPLPVAFRTTAEGEVVEIRAATGGKSGGRAAGGGRGSGRVHDGDGMPDAGAVLVVRTLDPALATVLPQLGGLVSETGSVLSHLAVLAREFNVPVVVGVPDAVRRFPPGSEVLVDGTTGEVSVLHGTGTSDLRGGGPK